MSSKAQRFALQVINAFQAAGHYTDQEVGDAGGPSTTTMTNVRKVAQGKGDMPEPRGDTYRKIDTAAEWMPGSARALWRDGTPPRPTTASRLREGLGDESRSPDEVRRDRRRVRSSEGLDGYVQLLADRLLEVEERLDLLEMELKGSSNPALSEGSRRTDLAIAADEQGSIAGEQESTNET